MGIIPQEKVDNIIILGELGLDGHINPVTGVLPVIHYALKQGIKKCIVPAQNSREAALISDMEVIPVTSLVEVTDYLNDVITIEPEYVDVEELLSHAEHNVHGDFSDIKGQPVLKRGMEIAASGMHNILMTGSAGSGKSMIAKRLPTILPQLTFEESIEITKIYSVAGLLKEDQPIVTSRPFRSPHHTISTIALAGGGREPKPGEISLSHNGVLFLDELPEFNRNVLEVMRQPLEDRKVTISRINGIYRFPASFMLVAARNCCPCGMAPDMSRCTCSFKQIKQYNSKISRPLLDRIDINIQVQKVAFKDLYNEETCENSKTIRERVNDARKIQADRYKNEKINFNSQLDGCITRKYIQLGSSEQDFLQSAFEETDMSARGSSRILKIARTIADMDGMERIDIKHLKEAVFFRNE
jgi:magnesium chelatase family protein